MIFDETVFDSSLFDAGDVTEEIYGGIFTYSPRENIMDNKDDDFILMMAGWLI